MHERDEKSNHERDEIEEGIKMERILRHIVEMIESAIESWCSTMWVCS